MQSLTEMTNCCPVSLTNSAVSRPVVSLQYERTVSAVFDVDGSVDVLVELLQVYREKGVIFSQSCTLLGVLCYDAGRKQVSFVFRREHKFCRSDCFDIFTLKR